MKNVLKAEQIREAERIAENAGLDEKLLRVNAALAVADDMLDRVQDRLAHTAVFCGTGGNGYDGLLAACRLHRKGGDVTAYLVGAPDKYEKSVIAYAQAEGIARVGIRRRREYNYRRYFRHGLKSTDRRCDRGTYKKVERRGKCVSAGNRHTVGT